jgi:flagellar hook-associated protein 2
MVTGGSVDGMISGMQTSTVISQLMQAEAAPQTALKGKVSTQQKVVTSYQNINTKMNALLTAAKGLNDPLAWKSSTATASSDAVLATTSTTGSSQSGSVTFTVKKLAAAESHLFSGRVATTSATVTGASTITVTNTETGHPTDLAITDTSLKGVVDAINKSADLGVKASAIQVSPGQYTLQLTATTTGKASAFTVTGINGLGSDLDPVTSGPLTAGDDAVLSVGTSNAIDVSSATNTFTGLMDGLTVTAKKVQAVGEAPVTVTVAGDTDGIAAKVQAMVDAANAALTEIGTQTKNASGAVAGGVLAGNSIMQALSGRILETVSKGAGPDTVGGNSRSLKEIGIQLTRDGQLSFDKTAFVAALNADPVKTQSYFNGPAKADPKAVRDGFADGMVNMANKATMSNTGTLAQLISSGNNAITDLNHRITDWDVRLSTRQQTLQKQFTAMETALGKLKNQSSWLSGQLSSLG